jgi:hypothetical protein
MGKEMPFVVILLICKLLKCLQKLYKTGKDSKMKVARRRSYNTYLNPYAIGEKVSWAAWRGRSKQ